MSDIGPYTRCDKCGGKSISWKMCWFTEDYMCDVCQNKQYSYRIRMRMAGMDDYKFEGCGYVPEIEDKLLE